MGSWLGLRLIWPVGQLRRGMRDQSHFGALRGRRRTGRSLGRERSKAVAATHERHHRVSHPNKHNTNLTSAKRQSLRPRCWWPMRRPARPAASERRPSCQTSCAPGARPPSNCRRGRSPPRHQAASRRCSCATLGARDASGCERTACTRSTGPAVLLPHANACDKTCADLAPTSAIPRGPVRPIKATGVLTRLRRPWLLSGSTRAPCTAGMVWSRPRAS